MKNQNNSKTHMVTPDRILTQLRNDIITKIYEPGEFLIEEKISQRFQASRSSVRTAIQTLANEGLIEILPNGRKEVLGFTRKQAEDMYDLRILIENRALEIAINDKDTFFSPILEVLHKIEIYDLDKHSDVDWYDLDIQFHRALVQSANNMPLVKAWEINAPVMYALMNLNTTKDYNEAYVREFYEKHKRLLEYIANRDAKCFDELKKHIVVAKDITFTILD
jgi:GntR family transcriptional regulator of gluconate operon